jgi:hypothetical protein
MMQALENEAAAGGSEEVGEPVVGVITTAARGEALVELIDDPDECEDADDGEDEKFPLWVLRMQPIEIGAEQAAAAEEVAEVLDLIEVINGRRDAAEAREGGQPAEDGKPENEATEPEVWAARNPKHVRSQLAHFFFEALGKPLLHHRLIIEKTGAGDAFDP